MYTDYEREYGLLKTDVAEIRAAIRRFVGFVIGTEGVALFVYRSFLSSPGEFVLVVSIIILTLLYAVINYKLASHNRHIAYLQLLTQEVARMKYDSREPPALHANKIVIGKDRTASLEDRIDHVVGWEYIMSRWNSVARSSRTYPAKRMMLLDFMFALSNPSRQKEVEAVGAGESAQRPLPLFLEHIVWGNYNQGGLWRALYDRVTGKRYKKYRVHSWKYPAYVFILTFTQIVLLTILLLSADTLLHGPFDIAAYVLVICAWSYFIYDLMRLLFYDKSIDFYCWAFFPFRVQLLNYYGIRPIYFSTAYARYCRSLTLFNMLDKLETIDTRTISDELKQAIEHLKQNRGRMKRSVMLGLRFNKREKQCMKLVATYIDGMKAGQVPGKKQ